MGRPFMKEASVRSTKCFSFRFGTSFFRSHHVLFASKRRPRASRPLANLQRYEKNPNPGSKRAVPGPRIFKSRGSPLTIPMEFPKLGGWKKMLTPRFLLSKLHLCAGRLLDSLMGRTFGKFHWDSKGGTSRFEDPGPGNRPFRPRIRIPLVAL